ncbi:hypothetical protein ASE14_07305 [Agromyces sp. Root81]|nr:hypothetical protein ASE14_07305 [Agromyces sp. Root81]
MVGGRHGRFELRDPVEFVVTDRTPRVHVGMSKGRERLGSRDALEERRQFVLGHGSSRDGGFAAETAKGPGAMHRGPS